MRWLFYLGEAVMRYWLFKSEPESFGIDTLSSMPKQTEHWDGVRNYQARNMMRDDMREGDLGFFYHSNCTPPGIAGLIEVVRTAYILISLHLIQNQNTMTPKAHQKTRAGLWWM